MRLIKLALISFTLLFLLVTGISLFIPSRVRISRATNINSNKQKILAPVKDPAQWKSWYPGLDTAKLYMETGQAKGVLMNSSGSVRLVLSDSTSNEIQATFISGQKPVLNAWNVIEHAGTDSTTLQWYMDFHLRWYPWEKFTSLLFDKSYGPKMEEGLKRLKELAEK